MKMNINQSGLALIPFLIILALAAVGVYFYVSQKPFPYLVKNPSPTAGADTTNWQTYRNEQYGFEVRYPKDWILRDSRLFTKDGNEAFYISASETKYNLITNWLDVEFSGDRAQFKPTYTNLNISNYVWIHYPEPMSIGGCDEVTTTIRKKILYRLRTPPSSCEFYETSSQIPSTFKFLR